MKLARYRVGDDAPRLAAVVGDAVIDLHDVGGDADSVVALWELGADALARAVAEAGRERHPLASVHLCAPIARPPKFFAVGLNYADHVIESGLTAPEVPVVFNKQSTCVTGPYDPILSPLASDQLDYEGELAFVVGVRCRHVPAERAHEVIAGYLVADDVSVRDWQTATPTMTLGKSFDTHGPLGPWLTTADEVDDPHALRLRTWVNGELRQDSSTRHLVQDCFRLVEHLSTVCTLEPGDVVTTGTPAGVGFGFAPPRPLVSGDVVRIEVEGLGALENTVEAEADDAPRIQIAGVPAGAH